MSLALSLEDAGFTQADLTRSKPQRSQDPRSTHGIRRQQALLAPPGVPMLDWPADLFDDNASMGDLIAEDCALEYDPFALSCDREIFAQAA
jgi:hypothetical protein